MKQKDEKILLDLLKEGYKVFKEETYEYTNVQEVIDNSKYSRDEIEHVLKRVEGQYFDLLKSIQGINSYQITAEGIEKLSEEGHETILDSKIRYEILKILYQQYRNSNNRRSVSREDLIDEIDDPDLVDTNIWYLDDKGIVEKSAGGGGILFRSATITSRGLQRYEEYDESGVEIPRKNRSSQFKQVAISEGETQKAENMFRDFVELSNDEVILIDAYAGKKLLNGKLTHVPKGVDIKILTSDRVFQGSNAKKS
jgi:hypothetical protein